LAAACALRDASRSILSTARSSDPVLLAAVHQHQRRRHVKVFDGRDEKRELLADQLVRFERLRDAETNTT
jgi:putative heme iron utilization protein